VVAEVLGSPMSGRIWRLFSGCTALPITSFLCEVPFHYVVCIIHLVCWWRCTFISSYSYQL